MSRNGQKASVNNKPLFLAGAFLLVFLPPLFLAAFLAGWRDERPALELALDLRAAMVIDQMIG